MDQHDLGERIAEGRGLAGRTQEELADAVGLPRTAISKIERGEQRVDALALASIGQSLGLPIAWFLDARPPLLQSRREGRAAAEASPAIDTLLERLVAAAEQVDTLDGPPPHPLRRPPPETETHAVKLAGEVRTVLDNVESPLLDLVGACEGFGLWAFCLELGDDGFDGATVALDGRGLALINAAADPGRRRFTLAHELGHHIIGDEYVVHRGAGGGNGLESRLNTFAGHLLLPDRAITKEWEEHEGHRDTRDALIRIGVAYRLSWSAVIARARQAGVIDHPQEEHLRAQVPRGGELLERGLFLVDELQAPKVPAGYSAAVLKAFRRHDLSPQRALELLFGAVSEDGLPDRDELPLKEFVADLQGLG